MTVNIYIFDNLIITNGGGGWICIADSNSQSDARERVETESITHKYCNSSTKPKFYKNTRLIGKIIEKASLANFYSKTHITQITSL